MHGRDIDQNGGDELVPSDQQTFDEVIVDMPAAYQAIADKVINATQNFSKRGEKRKTQ